jgi:hypothetical protein
MIVTKYSDGFTIVLPAYSANRVVRVTPQSKDANRGKSGNNSSKNDRSFAAVLRTTQDMQATVDDSFEDVYAGTRFDSLA